MFSSTSLSEIPPRPSMPAPLSIRASLPPPSISTAFAVDAQATALDRETSLESWDDASAREALAQYEGMVRVEARRLRSPAMRTNTLDEEDLRAEGRIAVLE